MYGHFGEIVHLLLLIIPSARWEFNSGGVVGEVSLRIIVFVGIGRRSGGVVVVFVDRRGALGLFARHRKPTWNLSESLQGNYSSSHHLANVSCGLTRQTHRGEAYAAATQTARGDALAPQLYDCVQNVLKAVII